MKKPVFGMLLGGLLGIPDGLSALVSAGDDPNVRAGIVGIVIGSTVKGLITGLLIGWFARKVNSLPLGDPVRIRGRDCCWRSACRECRPRRASRRITGRS